MRHHKPVETTGVTIPTYYREDFFSRFARFYDPLVKLSLLPFGGEKRFRKKFMDFANLEKGEQVLDVCCGTGGLTSQIADRVGSSGRVIGVDLSSSMIEIARRKTRSSVVSFESVNSESLPFPENTFDRSFISLALHEMPETARRNTLKEIYRTLRPGGILFVLDYNLPRGAFARLIIKAFVRLIEDEFAYRMLLDGSLMTEIEEAGLTIERNELTYGGMIQMTQARKIPEGDGDG